MPIILKSVLYVCHVVGLYMRKSKFYTLKIWLFQKISTFVPTNVKCRGKSRGLCVTKQFKVSPKHGKSSSSQNGWQVGIKPGVKVDLTSKLSFIAHVGFFGYQDADDEYCAWGEDGFGFKLDGNSLNFGLYYNF